MEEIDMNDDPSEIGAMVRAARRDRFAPGFADRVMDRLRETTVLSLGARMQRPFRWLVPAAVAAILFLGFLNIRAAGATGVGTLDAALGLPHVTLSSAYAFDSGR
jgi:hypothetical protein